MQQTTISLSRPAWLALCGLSAFPFALGCWQTRRFFEKERQLRDRQAVVALPAVPFPNAFRFAAAELADLAATSLAFRSVRLRGRFENDKTMLVGPRPERNGERGSTGYLVLTPFLREEDFLRVLVNRGWVARADVPSVAALPPVSAAEVNLVGFVRPIEEKHGAFSPANVPEKGQWSWLDGAAMAAAASQPGAPCLPILIEQASKGPFLVGQWHPCTFPVDKQRHVEYAATWFSLTAALVVAAAVLKKRVRRAPTIK